MNSQSIRDLLGQYVLNMHEQRLSTKHWPYVTKIETDNVFPAERWCYGHFKSRNWRNYGVTFAFKRKEDYEWFVLRWS